MRGENGDLSAHAVIRAWGAIFYSLLRIWTVQTRRSRQEVGDAANAAGMARAAVANGVRGVALTRVNGWACFVFQTDEWRGAMCRDVLVKG